MCFLIAVPGEPDARVPHRTDALRDACATGAAAAVPRRRHTRQRPRSVRRRYCYETAAAPAVFSVFSALRCEPSKTKILQLCGSLHLFFTKWHCHLYHLCLCLEVHLLPYPPQPRVTAPQHRTARATAAAGGGGCRRVTASGSCWSRRRAAAAAVRPCALPPPSSASPPDSPPIIHTFG